MNISDSILINAMDKLSLYRVRHCELMAHRDELYNCALFVWSPDIHMYLSEIICNQSKLIVTLLKLLGT